MSGKRVSIPPRPPADPAAEVWVRQGTEGGNGAAPPGPLKADLYTARLTVDVTPELRGRIKVIAFRRGVTVADMLRALLEREYPDEAGTA